MSEADDELDLFLNGFTARNIAEPLMSFDETSSAARIHAAMQEQHLKFAGVRRQGAIAGWLSNEDVTGSNSAITCRSFESKAIVLESASLNQVVERLNSAPCLFVRSLG